MMIFNRMSFGRKKPMSKPLINAILEELKKWATQAGQRPEFEGVFYIKAGQGRLNFLAELNNSMITFNAYPSQREWYYWY